MQHVGLVIEQHPERTRLFMQWQQMDWPLMVDPFNLLDMRLVPCTLAIDEHGIIQAVQPRLDRADDLVTHFVHTEFEPPTDAITTRNIITQANEPASNDARALSDYAVALTLWGGSDDLNAAIRVSEQALGQRADDRTHFNLGVIYRMRYDSAFRQEEDFGKAIEHWTHALNYDPNNYIWRRRIQQYGPRLDKPYSFYDWVEHARADITERGEKPVPLTIEPKGAEFAHPTHSFTKPAQLKNPDPCNRIYQDEHPLVFVDVVVVPPQVVAGESVRVHITMHPTEDAHWNNEVDDTVLWVNEHDGWTVDAQLQSVPNGAGATSHEARSFEFEIQSSDALSEGITVLQAYSLYYICEDVNGVCLYRRQDINIPIEILSVTGRRLKDGT